MFKISFLSEQSNSEASAEIVVNDFRERLSIPLGYWAKNDYEEQWIAAITSILEPNTTKAALVTEMYDPLTANFINIWPLYKDDDRIYIQNSILFLDKLKGDFQISQLSSYVLERETINEDGDDISEWNISIKDLEEFISESRVKVGH